jgi:hypothetical protein
METTRNPLPEHVKLFFKRLNDYLETTLTYYGSVQRYDYFSEHSDVDVAIFAHDENSIILKLQHFLHIKRSDFRRFEWEIKKANINGYGYKLKYINNEKKINAEFVIYNEKYKDLILSKHKVINNLPIYTVIMLYILKIFYYTYPILSKSFFFKTKKILFDKTMGTSDDLFVVLDHL